MAAKPKWLKRSIERLRMEATKNAIHDENGKITHTGYPSPGTVINELRYAYQQGKRDASQGGRECQVAK